LNSPAGCVRLEETGDWPQDGVTQGVTGEKRVMEIQEYRSMYELEDHIGVPAGDCGMTEGLLARHNPALFCGRRPRLLDLGCGTGLWLARRAADCDPLGLDFSREALGFCRQRGLGRIMPADAAACPSPMLCVDILSAFDLIEHVADDAGLIGEAWRVLRPGGSCSPACGPPLLWTGHDISLHHRRVTGAASSSALRSGTLGAGADDSCFTLIFPPAAAIRLTRRLLLRRRPPIPTRIRRPSGSMR
jgi:SAM-dependent methyltransferase